MQVSGRPYPGVYAADAKGDEYLVHLFQGGVYTLGQVVEVFGLGMLDEDAAALTLTRREIAELKTLADAYSFDYDDEFIEMCYDIHRVGSELGMERCRFEANF